MSWKKVKLNSVAEIIAGQSPESKYYNQTGEGYPFFQGKADFTKDYPIVRYWCSQPTKIAKPFDILLSVRAPVGPTNICNIEACVGRGLAAIRVSDKLDYKYLYFYFKSIEEKLSSQGNGSTFSAITVSVVKEIEIPLPPLPTQKRIAEILDAADALRRKDLELLRKYDELAQAIFIDMFGDPVKNVKGWEVKKFGDYINVLTDYHSNGSYETLRDHVQLKTTPDYALMVRTTDLEKNNFEDDVNYITKEAYEHLEKSKVFGGEIIINKIGSAGKVYLMPYLNRPVSLGMNSFLLRLNNKMNPVFAYYFLTSQFGEYEISKRVFGAVTKTITKDAVRSIPMYDIPLDLQDKYVSMIEKINLMKTNKNSDYSKTLFDSLLQQAFKGELVK